MLMDFMCKEYLHGQVGMVCLCYMMTNASNRGDLNSQKLHSSECFFNLVPGLGYLEGQAQPKTVKQSLYTWPLHGVWTSHTWQLGSERKLLKREHLENKHSKRISRSCMALYDLALEVIQHHFYHIFGGQMSSPLVGQSQ